VADLRHRRAAGSPAAVHHPLTGASVDNPADAARERSPGRPGSSADVDVDADALASSVAGWDPQVVVAEDPMHASPSAALAATLDRPAPGGTLPPLWHWVYFPDWVPASQLGPDGHRATGGVYPSIPERTRMHLGGWAEWRHPLRIGSPARRRTEVTRRRVTVGRSGAMLLVTVRHEISQDGRLAVVEEQDVLYRSGRAPSGTERSGPDGPRGTAAGEATSPEGPWRASVPTDPVCLFRFSALTANCHRIHYDYQYATNDEGYPGLVVHGPLLALAMVTLAADRSGRPVGAARYKLLQPTFATEIVEVLGGPTEEGALVGAVVHRGGTDDATALAAAAAPTAVARAEVGWS